MVELAEAVRFELTNGCPLPVFKTGAIDHSATLPANLLCAQAQAAPRHRSTTSTCPDRRRTAADDSIQPGCGAGAATPYSASKTLRRVEDRCLSPVRELK